MLNVFQAFVPFIVLMVVPLVGAVVVLAVLGQRAKRFGYALTGAYLRAAPRTTWRNAMPPTSR